MNWRIFQKEFHWRKTYVKTIEEIKNRNEMSKMFLQWSAEYNYVVYIDATKLIIVSQNVIYLLLHVWWCVLETYDFNIELFLITMCNDDQFMSVFLFYKLLIKKRECIYRRYIETFDDWWNNVCLQRHRVCIDFCYSV